MSFSFAKPPETGGFNERIAALQDQSNAFNSQNPLKKGVLRI
jgi:hypothetical protein